MELILSPPESRSREGAASLGPGTTNTAKKSQRSYLKNADHLAGRRDVSSLEKRVFVLLVLLLQRIIEINGTTAEITVKVCLIMGRNGREDSSADVPGDAHLGLRPWIRSLTALRQGRDSGEAGEVPRAQNLRKTSFLGSCKCTQLIKVG